MQELDRILICAKFPESLFFRFFPCALFFLDNRLLYDIKMPPVNLKFQKIQIAGDSARI